MVLYGAAIQKFPKKSKTFARQIAAWGLFLGFCVPAAGQTRGPDSEQDAAPELPSKEPTPIGPTHPIGHSLKTPEARKRIESLINQGKFSEEDAKHVAEAQPATSDGHAAPLGNLSLSVASQESQVLPPLVGGRYGFPEPPRFDGVPKAFVSLGSVFPAYAFVVEKLHHRLTVFRLGEDRKFEVVKSYRAITGKDPGDKLERGDLRTPEGIYFITGKLHDQELPPKYGRMAFTLDYPNIFDRRQRKSGYGIWVHGTDDPKRLLKPYDTEGCVVVSNEDLVELQKFIAPFETPVVITKEMTTGTQNEVEIPRKLALDMIEAWRKSWEDSNLESYISFYSPNFQSLGKNRDGWLNFKTGLSKARKREIKVTITEPKILAFEDQLLVTFFQDYSSKQHSDFGRKFVYLQWENNRYRIIAEKWYPAKKTETVVRSLKRFPSQM